MNADMYKKNTINPDVAHLIIQGVKKEDRHCADRVIIEEVKKTRKQLKEEALARQLSIF